MPIDEFWTASSGQPKDEGLLRRWFEVVDPFFDWLAGTQGSPTVLLTDYVLRNIFRSAVSVISDDELHNEGLGKIFSKGRFASWGTNFKAMY